jgi:hypothetical protein
LARARAASHRRSSERTSAVRAAVDCSNSSVEVSFTDCCTAFLCTRRAHACMHVRANMRGVCRCARTQVWLLFDAFGLLAVQKQVVGLTGGINLSILRMQNRAGTLFPVRQLDTS